MSRDDEDLERFFRDEFTAIVRTVFLVCHDHHRAEEIAQEAFLQLIRHWDRVRSFDRPEAWVRRVAIRLAVKTVRRDERRRRAERAAPVPFELRARDRDVMNAVRRLPGQQRAAVVLYYFEDRPVDEVADLLGCAAATARVHIHRAREHLALELGEGVIDRVSE